MTKDKYRWLVKGDVYTYQPAKDKGMNHLRGQICKVLTLPKTGSKPANVRVMFLNGEIHIVPHGALRRYREF